MINIGCVAIFVKENETTQQMNMLAIIRISLEEYLRNLARVAATTEGTG